MTKTTTKTTKIPFASWLKTKDGKSFLNICDTYTDPDDGCFQDEIRSFGKDGWVTIWVKDGEPEDFPYVDSTMTDRKAFGVLYCALKEHAEDAAIILTYGTNYSDDRENFAYDCLKAIAGDSYSPLPH